MNTENRKTTTADPAGDNSPDANCIDDGGADHVGAAKPPEQTNHEPARGTTHQARRRSRRGKFHAHRAGKRGDRTGHRRHHSADWDDAEHLERYQRDLEQRAADTAARIDDVSERIKELRA